MRTEQIDVSLDHSQQKIDGLLILQNITGTAGHQPDSEKAELVVDVVIAGPGTHERPPIPHAAGGWSKWIDRS
jgi:hypothetical protein